MACSRALMPHVDPPSAGVFRRLRLRGSLPQRPCRVALRTRPRAAVHHARAPSAFVAAFTFARRACTCSTNSRRTTSRSRGASSRRFSTCCSSRSARCSSSRPASSSTRACSPARKPGSCSARRPAPITSSPRSSRPRSRSVRGGSSSSACRSSSRYGIISGVPWYFYALLPLYLLGYVLLPGSVSAAGCLLLVRYMPRNRKQFFAARRAGGRGRCWCSGATASRVRLQEVDRDATAANSTTSSASSTCSAAASRRATG